MAFCSNCGNRLADGAKFCNECGAKTADPKQGEQQAPSPEKTNSQSIPYQPNHTQRPQQKPPINNNIQRPVNTQGSKNSPGVPVIIIVLVLVILAGGFFLVRGLFSGGGTSLSKGAKTPKDAIKSLYRAIDNRDANSFVAAFDYNDGYARLEKLCKDKGKNPASLKTYLKEQMVVMDQALENQYGAKWYSDVAIGNAEDDPVTEGSLSVVYIDVSFNGQNDRVRVVKPKGMGWFVDIGDEFFNAFEAYIDFLE